MQKSFFHNALETTSILSFAPQMTLVYTLPLRNNFADLCKKTFRNAFEKISKDSFA
jgi:hypothetical protein